jgi:hypothetical protein
MSNERRDENLKNEEGRKTMIFTGTTQCKQTSSSISSITSSSLTPEIKINRTRSLIALSGICNENSFASLFIFKFSFILSLLIQSIENQSEKMEFMRRLRERERNGVKGERGEKTVRQEII